MRKVIERKFGSKFADFMRNTASDTGKVFAQSQHALRDGEPDLPGDVWYWLHTNNGDGHTAIRVGKRDLAQNTTRGYDGHDARIIVDRNEHAPPDVRVRLR